MSQKSRLTTRTVKFRIDLEDLASLFRVHVALFRQVVLANENVVRPAIGSSVWLPRQNMRGEV
jgi:hypothetical protein